jgi:hypothetical protein
MSRRDFDTKRSVVGEKPRSIGRGSARRVPEPNHVLGADTSREQINARHESQGGFPIAAESPASPTLSTSWWITHIYRDGFTYVASSHASSHSRWRTPSTMTRSRYSARTVRIHRSA